MTSNRLTRALAVCAFVIAVTHGAAGALVHFDFEQKYFAEPGQEVLDHYLMEVDGVIHLFYLRGNPAVNVGHATTTDLVHWNIESPVLTLGAWDNRAMWAPHLLENPNGSGWFMYYTGVNTNWAQQSGVAFSPDLYNWAKYPAPVYNPDPNWAQWADDFFAHGRDPHVVEHNGQFYMFATAKTWQNQGAVACAVSDDLINWQDIGPVYVHNTWHVMESIFVMYKNDQWNMFFTEEAVNGTSHITSPDLTSGWNFSTRRIIDIGHAPQVSPMSDGTEIFSRHHIYNDNHGLQMYTLRMDTLIWVNGIPAPSRPWPLQKDWINVQGTAFTFQPTFGNNPYVRFEDVEPTYEGFFWIGTNERYGGPMSLGTPGATQGEDRTGVIRSRNFSITGNSMSLLVGGTNDPDQCYVALVDVATGATLFSETGAGVEEMTRRYWNLFPYVGRSVYVEIADLSETGHINVDDIAESSQRIDAPEGRGNGKIKPERLTLGDGPPRAAVLHQNTPNPFNPATTIRFELPAGASVRLDVYDVSGRLVRRLVDENRARGPHGIEWDGRDDRGIASPSGVYFYRLSVDGTVVDTRKMMLVK